MTSALYAFNYRRSSRNCATSRKSYNTSVVDSTAVTTDRRHALLRKLKVGSAAYDKIHLSTAKEVKEAKKLRPHRFDAYAIVKGITKVSEEVLPNNPNHQYRVLTEEILTYSDFLSRIHELEWQNADLDQIICVFTTNRINPRYTGNEKCDAIEALIKSQARKLQSNCSILTVRVGTFGEWMDPSNPYRNDERINLTSIPTVMVWGTMKKLSGRRLFNLDNISTLLED